MPELPHPSTEKPLGTEGLPVFKSVFRRLLLGSVLMPPLAALLVYGFESTTSLPSWLVGLMTGSVVAVGIAASVWNRLDVAKRSLDEISHWLHRPQKDPDDKTLDMESDAETTELRRAINRISTSLYLVREENEAMRFLQEVIDALPDPLVVLNENGSVELANHKFAALLSFENANEPVGRGLSTLAGNHAPEWYQELLIHGKAGAIEVDFKTKDGDTVTLLASGVLVEDDTSVPNRVVLLVREPDQLEQLSARLEAAESEAAESAAVFQNLFDAIEDPITVLGLNGEVLQANRAARTMFGRQVVGQKCYRAFRMRDSICEDCPATETYASKSSTSVEHRVFGNAITRINTYPLLGKNGEIRAILNHKRDVTKERQLEDLKSNFLAAVSHELRTPLTSIIGFNKLNRRRLTRHLSPILETAPHKARIAFQQTLDDMDIMVSEGERLGRLVNDVLDLSKLEAGRMKLHMDAVDLAQVLHGAVAATSALWRQKGLQMDCELPLDLPKAWGDADRLAQVVVNLLSNATKFTDEGTISVSVERTESMLTVTVTDTGQGIPPEQLNGIFEKFSQVDSGQLNKPLGTGLGLPICKELIQLHGGQIWVDSQIDQGTSFHFSVVRMDNQPVASTIRDRTSFSGLE